MEQRPTNGAAIASLVIGIVGIVLCVTRVLSILGIILGIVGIILSASSKKNFGPSGMATAGLVLGILSIVFGSIFLVTCSCTVCGGACLGLLG